MQLLAQRDFWSGVMFASVGVAFLVLAQQNSLGSAADMGPAYFPSLISILLVALGLALCARAAWTSEAIELAGLRPLVVVVAATLSFGFLLERCGLVLATAALVGIGAFARSAPRPLETAALAVALAAISSLVFVWGLGVLLPLWPKLS